MKRELRTVSLLFAAVWPLSGLLCLITLPDNRWQWVPWTLLESGAWSLMTPFVVGLADRFPIRSGKRALLIHGVWVSVFAAVWTGAAIVAEKLLHSSIACSLSLPPVYVTYSILNYATIVWAVTLVQARRGAQWSDLTRERVEHQLSRARLDEVRAAIDPDALFASLGRIDGELVGGTATAAEEHLLELCRALRAKLVPARRHLRSDVRGSGVPPLPHPAVWSVILLYPLWIVLLNLMFILRAMFVREPIPWIIVRNMLVVYAVAGLFSPIIVAASRRFVIRGPQRARNACYVALVCAIHLALTLVSADLLHRAGWGRPPGEILSAVVVLTVAAVCVVQADAHSRSAWGNMLDAARLRQSVAEATLRSLRTQLAPHFLFNALNSVLALLRLDRWGAHQMLDRLRSLLQVTLRAEQRHEVSLSEDLAIAMSYVEVERVRYREALDFHVEVEPSLLSARVPVLLLQPLIENAVRHGVLASAGHGAIRLRASRTGSAIEIAVDNEAELLDPASWREGIGLSNLRARLAQLYGPDHALSTISLAHGGVRVQVTIPLRTEPMRAEPFPQGQMQALPL